MLNVQKFTYDKIALGSVESGLSYVVTPPKFVLAMSMPTPKVRVPKEKVLATRRIRVDLSETQETYSSYREEKKQASMVLSLLW